MQRRMGSRYVALNDEERADDSLESFQDLVGLAASGKLQNYTSLSSRTMCLYVISQISSSLMVT